MCVCVCVLAFPRSSPRLPLCPCCREWCGLFLAVFCPVVGHTPRALPCKRFICREPSPIPSLLHMLLLRSPLRTSLPLLPSRNITTPPPPEKKTNNRFTQLHRCCLSLCTCVLFAALSSPPLAYDLNGRKDEHSHPLPPPSPTVHTTLLATLGVTQRHA